MGVVCDWRTSPEMDSRADWLRTESRRYARTMRTVFLWIVTAVVFAVTLWFATQPGSGGSLAWVFWLLIALLIASLTIAAVFSIRRRRSSRS